MAEWKTCETCDGKGAFYGETCDTCGGVGKVSVSKSTPSPASTAGDRQSIGDDETFHALLAYVMVAAKKFTPITEQAEKINELIAHIDALLLAGRSAGDAVPAGWKVEHRDDVFLGKAIKVSNPDEGFSTLREKGHDPRETVLYRFFSAMIGAAPAPGNTAKPEGDA